MTAAICECGHPEAEHNKIGECRVAVFNPIQRPTVIPCPCRAFKKKEASRVEWPIGAVHPAYGTVSMAGVTGGEPYRWFIAKDGSVAMMPLDSLPKKEASDADSR